ncbi:hypothetical protein [Halobacterium sp. KA-6]|uniref:hypothetical protein n=1 Tax=Halobacterium sp. KA-6 TaxID=2896368 RepID=UPI001E56966A|nr:hypothetical protein [Halobacterium sp. KA-6]MCD2205273.1 hypothetical protein [Halobacterium sp. KA-6]
MARTVTVRLSVVVGVVLLVAGGGFYGYGAYDAATYDREAGIDVAPTSTANATATNFSDLPREQQALFLLAVEPGQDSYYMTTDEGLQELASEIPSRVRYDTTIYDVSGTHTDAVVGMYTIPFGMLIAAIGSVTLLGAGATSILRKVRD